MKPDSRFQKIALLITHGIGSPTSIVLHTILFTVSFLSVIIGVIPWNEMLLVLTTLVSLEAIYLSLFIQMTVNLTTASLREVVEDIDEMQEDVNEIQKDIDEIQEDVGDLHEDVEEISEDDAADLARKLEQKKTLETIQTDLRKLMQDIDRLKVN